ncbi:MAG: methylmalonyl-CoA mutase, partial [Chloroflexia bacterium]|nr:methylmalonyl-CoA mutase [Chloroflexia bacterium]
LGVDDVAPRMSFFFAAHSRLFEEVAKFRAARRMWAGLVRERYAPNDPRSEMVRFHTQTGGVTLTAQQPLNNVVRVAYQSLAAVLGGTQSLHTNGYDEALAIPSEDAATLALRTQQILAEETGVAASADPLAGSYLVEALTDEVEAKALELIREIDAGGGAVEAVERGEIQAAIAETAYRKELARERGQDRIVGVNVYRSADGAAEAPMILHRLDADAVERQVSRVNASRASQDTQAVGTALAEVRSAATGDANLLPPMRTALLAGATLGQVVAVLRDEFGQYRPG